ncbi:abscisic acid-deficient protein Aba4 family protein [Streptomyces sp. NBC_00094]|uniref:abscisic acid-deficient protein Aba4 family protein n=1 Tax=Streptomyces sp. NBC_00094 TaxID=2903620 RepID=UPI002252B101|nr:abscisic acid-deficient protein Aba4 family protein [Streptomyces sp. NBC_00094]MCX5389666.1 ABA4-like family protein [Streptomyces sp. NBC_00094]
MTGFLFELTFLLAAPVWLLMVFAPAWHVTERIAASPLTVLPLLALWAVLAAPVLPELWTAVSSPDLDTFRELATLPNGAAAIWAQIIAWDLLLGQWIYREGRRLALSPFLMAPLLLLTILLSPLALPLFLALRATRTRNTAPRPA